MKTLFEPNCDQEAVDWHYTGSEASARVKRFGNGLDNKSDFRILLTWDDIENAIAGMSARGNEKALQVERALALADAVHRLVGDSK